MRGRSLLILGAALALVALATVVVSCAGDTTTTTGAGSGTTTATGDSQAGASATTAPQRSGAALFAIHCAGCHGADGKSKLTPTPVGVDAAAVKAAIEKGKGSMAALGDRLSPADVEAIVTYVGTLK